MSFNVENKYFPVYMDLKYSCANLFSIRDLFFWPVSGTWGKYEILQIDKSQRTSAINFV